MTTNRGSAAAWADAFMFADFGPGRAAEVYEALGDVLDPANNGDADMFDELGAAYRRYRALDIVPAGRSDEELFRELYEAYAPYTADDLADLATYEKD